MGEASLIERLKAATEGSRELDALIEVAVRWDDAAKVGLAPDMRGKWRASRSGQVGDGHTTYASAPVTTSLDAIVGLIERKLPGCIWCAMSSDLLVGYAKARAELSEAEYSFNTIVGEATTPALALCIALLSALRGREPRP